MRSWSHASAGLGAAAWLALHLALPSDTELRTIALLLLLAVLVCVPLGLALVATPNRGGRHPWAYRVARRAQLGAALLAVGSYFLPTGLPAAAMATPWLAFTGLVALFGLSRLLPRGVRSAEEICIDAGLLYLPVGGAWLVLSRLGANPLGFGDTIVLLTAVHFHYAGFAAPILAGMAGRALRPSQRAARRAFRLVALGVVAGPPLLAAGITFSRALETAAALLLAASLIGLAGITALAVLSQMGSRLVQALLLVSAGASVGAMGFAIVYGLGALTGLRLLGIPQMVALHGWANALGFALCGLLAWTISPPQSHVVPPGVPFSRLASRGRVGAEFVHRVAATPGTRHQPSGMMDDLAAYRRSDFDPGRVHPAIRSFYECTASYGLLVRAEWRPGFRAAARIWKWFSMRIGQMDFPLSSEERDDTIASRIVAIDEAVDGRPNVRAWVRTYLETADPMYVAAYAHHTLGSQTYMNIAFPLPGGNLTSVLRIEEAPMGHQLCGVLLTTLSTPAAVGDEGVYFTTRALPVRLLLNERIYVWVEDTHQAPEDTAARLRELTVFGRHDIWFFGLPCLTLHYRIRPVAELPAILQPSLRTAESGEWCAAGREV